MSKVNLLSFYESTISGFMIDDGEIYWFVDLTKLVSRGDPIPKYTMNVRHHLGAGINVQKEIDATMYYTILDLTVSDPFVIPIIIKEFANV